MTKPKQKKKPSPEEFARQYILNGCVNGRQAAIAAGYSEKSAESQASRLLTTVKVKAAIEKHQKIETNSFIWNKQKKLEMLQDIATLSLNKIVDQYGNERSENLPAAVSAIKEHNAMQGDYASPNDVMNEDSQPLNITFEVRQAEDKIDITNAKS